VDCVRILPGACFGASHRSKRCSRLGSGLTRSTQHVHLLRFGKTKSQRPRHNIPEIAAFGPLQCHHVHDETEWTPVQVDGVTVYPSAEEAEYSANSGP
jgi:hypothetical protein